MAAARKPRGKLRIGDDWNAITIIALAQSNPLKAVAEFVENSIDAGARKIVVVKGKERGEGYLQISDDGEGVRKARDGVPDFAYVATHICDSFKRELQRQGAAGVQGEFGIGLLSFWTLGENLELVSADLEGRNHQMRMSRNDPNYEVKRLRSLVPVAGTDLKVRPLLPGIRHLSGEKLDWYLAAELRDRIRTSGVEIEIIDRQARRRFQVRPREFAGELIRVADEIVPDDAYLELYAADDGNGTVSLNRRGTRVLEDIAVLDELADAVWGSGQLEGIVDVPSLALTPGTRSGVIRDATFQRFVEAMLPVENFLADELESRRRAEEEQASKRLLQSLRRAFREALLALPAEEYDWFDIKQSAKSRSALATQALTHGQSEEQGIAEPDRSEAAAEVQRDFFDYPGPLHSARISPSSLVIATGASRDLRALARDKAGRSVVESLRYVWRIVEGAGSLDPADAEIVRFRAPDEPGLTRIEVEIEQAGTTVGAQAIVTVTDELVPQSPERGPRDARGLPGYTFEHAPGALWRSRFDAERNLIVVNNGHRDFVYASRANALKLRYIARLYAKELLLENFQGASGPEVLERMVELTLYLEDNLR